MLASSIRRATFAWLVMQACTTYDGIPHGDVRGDGGRAGGGGVGAQAGSALGGTPGSGGNSNGGSAGNAGTSSGGSAAEGGAPTQSEGGIGGASDVGGAATLGGAGFGGAGFGGATGDAGAAAEAGAGGGSAECLTASPDIGCSCEPHGTHEYWFCSQYLTFAAAENKCKSVTMHLPKIETQAEDDWLFAAAQAHALGEYFLGATDATTPDVWSWLAGGKFWTGVADGTASGYAHWSANEPNASGDCLVVQANGPWDDRTCTDQRRYVCESP